MVAHIIIIFLYFSLSVSMSTNQKRQQLRVTRIHSLTISDTTSHKLRFHDSFSQDKKQYFQHFGKVVLQLL